MNKIEGRFIVLIVTALGKCILQILSICNEKESDLPIPTPGKKLST